MHFNNINNVKKSKEKKFFEDNIEAENFFKIFLMMKRDLKSEQEKVFFEERQASFTP